MERPCILLSASRSGWQNYENAVLRAGGSVAGGYCPQPDAGYDGLLLCGGAYLLYKHTKRRREGVPS